MRRYLIGEVCAALGLKPHVLRYWEQQIGILSPAKNRAGRRVYTPADLQTLFRVKYLVQQRLFTLEGAANRILEESGGRSADAKARIQQLRQELLDALARIRASDSLLASARAVRESAHQDQEAVGGGPRPQLEWLIPGFDRRTAEERRRLLQAERLWSETVRVRRLIRAMRTRPERAPILPEGGSSSLFRCRRANVGSGSRGKPSGETLGRRSDDQASRAQLTAQLLVYQRDPQTAQRRPPAATAHLVKELAGRLKMHLREGYNLECELSGHILDRGELRPVPHIDVQGEPVLRAKCRLSVYWSPLLVLLQYVQIGGETSLYLLVPEEEIASVDTEALATAAFYGAGKNDAVGLGELSKANESVRATGPVALRAEALPGILQRLQPKVSYRSVERLIPGEERDDNENVEVPEYRVTPTTILKAAERPIIVHRR